MDVGGFAASTWREAVMDKRDAALAKSFPVSTVPKYGDFRPLENNGQRLLIAGNGFFLEVRRDWLHAIQECAYCEGDIRYPFGELESLVGLPISSQIGGLIRDFVAIARASLPNESGAVGVYDRTTGRCRLEVCNSLSASRARLTYAPPIITDAECIAVDIHSHADDVAAVKIAICVGHVDTEEPEVCARLCLSGLLLPMAISNFAISRLDNRVAVGTIPA
jgi:PRTRC genetic system protein A